LAILHWIWPPGRCQNCQSIYSSSLTDDVPSIKQIHRSDDGRFVLSEDAVDGVLVESKRNSVTLSQYSSSDDGGFLPKRSRISCPTWRRPLVQWPSQLSFRSDGQSSNRWIGLGRNLLQTIPQLHRPPVSHQNSVPVTENLHINTISANVPMISSNTYTPSRLSRIHASSPATSSPMVNSPWSPLYFSDLSSVHPSSAERSFPTQQGNIFSPNTNRSYRSSRNPRYINELPALRALHEETRRMTQGFIPVQIPSPPIRSYYANIGPHFYQPQSSLHNHPIMSYRSGRSRTFPRSYNRMMRAPPELASPLLNLNLNILEQSPESQSSSSGFGSKNTSSHQNQSSQSGGTANEWRLPPYRPPPQPASSLNHPHPSQYSYHDSLINSPSSPYSMSQWFELMQRLNLASASEFKAVDVGSVDGHYEFDPSTPTPTASTPTGRDELLQQQQHQLQLQHTNDIFGTLRSKRSPFHHPARYDQSTIDARVQAMKEEFYAFRKKQAIKRAGIVLESAC
jgi:immunoglobulin superfamily member 9B